uniref:Uncharacterized protein n=1 Tax=Arundo donax TaxID=35708 RepID=A0A0A8ZH60_ARUDO
MISFMFIISFKLISYKIISIKGGTHISCFS